MDIFQNGRYVSLENFPYRKLLISCFQTLLFDVTLVSQGNGSF